MQPLPQIIIIERVSDDETGYLPAGFMTEWCGPPESIPEGWKLADPELFLARIVENPHV